MSDSSTRQYWVFSNKHDGEYGGNDWDMETIRAQNRYYLKKSEPNRVNVQIGDVVYLRIFGDSYIGHFTVGSDWTLDPDWQTKGYEQASGYFSMQGVEYWQSPLPQSLIINDLSNGNVRRRIISIQSEDAIRIETAQRIYTHLGFGGQNADGQIIILEKGIEEAIKPNLHKLGLQLADDAICQQFAMGPGVGRSDLICMDESNNLVVIELKRGFTSDQTLGQLLRYMGYVQENIAKDGQQVFGAIVASDYDEHLRLAAKAAKVKLYLVRLG